MNSLTIGKLKLDGNLVLAPMSGITNLPSRLLCRKHGASLVYSEMTSSEAVVRQSLKSIERGFTCAGERPMGIQLMGAVPDNLAASAIFLQEKYRPELIDVNFGCPAQGVIKNGCGSGLLKKPELIGEIIRTLSDSLDIPLTAKIRILENFDETLKIAKIIEKAGADAITVHGRTQKQGYSGKSDLDFIKGIKSGLSIPVIANGDIFDEKTSQKVLEYTGCDGIMIGRAAIGNPFIFKKISYFLKTGEILPPREAGERLADFFEYTELCRNYGMHTYNDLKRNAQWFTKGMENVKQVRVNINKAHDIDSIMAIMNGLKDCV
ncbi:MAG: tRNA dihydrouridine synthase DusB [Candidatus Methanoperedens sp.]|nr:tRNA dihydrouridine synthase DusB [Candidatus Methanoperedens sp.]CAG0990548.1 tRNA-dihydrouridine synthase B [Methanosarcinales archaeon]